jgi:hypothetical protein
LQLQHMLLDNRVKRLRRHRLTRVTNRLPSADHVSRSAHLA